MMKRLLTGSMFLAVLGLQAQTLSEYYRIAADNNPGLQAQYRQVEAALQQVPQMRSLPDPTLSVSAFGQMVETRVGPQQARFSLSQMFPWFGTLNAQGNAAARMAEARYQVFLDARNKLYYEVAAAYYPLFELREWTRIEQENIEILESYKNISNSKFKNGMGSMVDVLRVDIMLQESKTSLEILTRKERPLRTAFNKLLNRNELEPVVISDSLVIEEVPVAVMEDSLLLNHPLMAAMDMQVQAGEEAERAAHLKGLPKWGIGVDYILVGEREDLPAGSPNIPSDNGKDAIMPMVSVTLPIFRGKYRSSVREAQLMQDQYTFEKNELANRLYANFQSAVFELERQRDLVHLLDRQILESQRALNLLFTAYGTSGKDFEEVLRMQQQLLQFNKLRITALTQHRLAAAQLEYITAKFTENENGEQ